MSLMKRLIIGMSITMVSLLLLVGAAWGWASVTAHAELRRTVEAHRIEIPAPWPLTEVEVAELRSDARDRLLVARAAQAMPALDADVDTSPDESLAASDAEMVPDFSDEELEIDLDAVALERALERGRYLIAARFPCAECHGHDFGGGVLLDDPVVGGFFGPNLTTGQGSAVADYTMADWDRIIRHGVKPDGRVSMMPSVDFFGMSDQELSDIVTTLRSMPPVDRQAPPTRLGPLGTALIATGAFTFSADEHEDHDAPHKLVPPPPDDPVVYGGHVAQACVGCHQRSFVGGPVVGAPPDWPAAANLTPHEEGLAGWSFEDFDRAMTAGIRPDGQEIRTPMKEVAPMAQAMTEIDRRAMYAYFMSLEPQPTGR